MLRPYLDKRQRRLMLAAEAVELGRGAGTTTSTRTLADALARDGHVVSDRTAAWMLRTLEFSREANAHDGHHTRPT